MTRHVLTLFLCICFLLPGAALASEQYAGSWIMRSMTLSVTVKSWGPHCGHRPVSYSSTKPRPVKIVAEGRHLIFSEGDIRTDRCGSPNPRLYTVSQIVGPAKWHRACQTAEDDPKFEKGRYQLNAEGPLKLIYTASSRFDWHLKGDHCAASTEETRIYARSKAGERAPKAQSAIAETRKSAARSDAQLTVVFPDLGELLAAHLSPPEEATEVEPRPAPKDLPLPPAAPVAPTQHPLSNGDSGTVAMIAIILAILVATAVLLVARKRRSAIDNSPSPVSWQTCPTCGVNLPPDALFCPHDRTRLGPVRATSQGPASPPDLHPNTGMVCPKCHRGYEGVSGFCPHDSQPLVPYQEWRRHHRD